MKLNYVATQLTPEGLDEVQRILLAYQNGHHVALSGPPGVGKTDLVHNFAKIVQTKVYEISCSALMTDGALIGYPELRGKNGSSYTEWVDGVAAQAAVKNGIFYGDEFDLLQGSEQKRLNPLFDQRRHVTRRDGELREAGDKFIGVISYNPSDRASKRELEEAVADRFVHMSFGYLPAGLEAALALKDFSGLTLEQRGVVPSQDKYRFVVKSGSTWKDIFSGEKVMHTDSVVEYNAMLVVETYNAPTIHSRADMAATMAEFVGSVRVFSEFGTNKLPDPIKAYLTDIGEITNVPLHKPSVRIMQAALAQYDDLVALGLAADKAQSYAARLVVDQTTYGKFGRRSLGSVSVHDAVVSMAQFHDLIGKPRHRTAGIV